MVSTLHSLTSDHISPHLPSGVPVLAPRDVSEGAARSARQLQSRHGVSPERVPHQWRDAYLHGSTRARRLPVEGQTHQVRRGNSSREVKLTRWEGRTYQVRSNLPGEKVQLNRWEGEAHQMMSVVWFSLKLLINNHFYFVFILFFLKKVLCVLGL